MKETSVAPYILAHRRRIKDRAARAIKERTDRLRSATFTMSECQGWAKVSVVHLVDSPSEMGEGICYARLEKGNPSKNSNEAINSFLLGAPAQVICVAMDTISADQVVSAFRQIESSGHDLIVCTEDYLFMSFELFFLAQGLDELLEQPEDAVYDLVLRAELLGGTLSGTWTGNAASGLAIRNANTGRLIVNQGSANWNQ